MFPLIFRKYNPNSTEKILPKTQIRAFYLNDDVLIFQGFFVW